MMAVTVAGRQHCKSTHTSNKRLAGQMLSRWKKVFEGRFQLPSTRLMEQQCVRLGFLAEREGFEPPIPFRVCRFSRPEPSTTRPPLPYYSFTTVLRSRAALRTSIHLNSIAYKRASKAVLRFSRPPVSTTHTSLRAGILGGCRLGLVYNRSHRKEKEEDAGVPLFATLDRTPLNETP